MWIREQRQTELEQKKARSSVRCANGFGFDQVLSRVRRRLVYRRRTQRMRRGDDGASRIIGTLFYTEQSEQLEIIAAYLGVRVNENLKNKKELQKFHVSSSLT